MSSPATLGSRNSFVSLLNYVKCARQLGTIARTSSDNNDEVSLRNFRNVLVELDTKKIDVLTGMSDKVVKDMVAYGEKVKATNKELNDSVLASCVDKAAASFVEAGD